MVSEWCDPGDLFSTLTIEVLLCKNTCSIVLFLFNSSHINKVIYIWLHCVWICELKISWSHIRSKLEVKYCKWFGYFYNPCCPKFYSTAMSNPIKITLSRSIGIFAISYPYLIRYDNESFRMWLVVCNLKFYCDLLRAISLVRLRYSCLETWPGNNAAS